MNYLNHQKNSLIHKFYFLLSFFLISLIFSCTFGSSGNDPMGCAIDDMSLAGGTPKVVIRADGTTLIDGEPFFPLGFYHIPSRADTGTEIAEINTLKDISAAGFNTLYAAVTNSVDDHERLLDEAEKLGVYVISANISDRDTIEIVNMFKNKPALLGWRIADDVGSTKEKYTADGVLDLHCRVKKADPNHITYISGGNSKRIPPFVNTADAVAVQAYPVGHKNDLPISWANQFTSVAHRSATEHRLIIANTQAFQWSDDRGDNVLTYEEVRNMSYQALLAGAKGIIYYAYYDGDWYLPEHSDLWSGIQSLAPEIKQLSPILLNGKLTQLNTSEENVLSGIWTYQDEALVMVVSTDLDETKEVSIPLSTKNIHQEKLISSDSASDIIFQDGKVNVSLDPLDVKLYKFSI